MGAEKKSTQILRVKLCKAIKLIGLICWNNQGKNIKSEINWTLGLPS